MHRLFILASVFLGLAAAALRVQAGDNKTDSYLGADGRLKAVLTVKDVQGGVAGFTGQLYTIQPNGDWTVQEVIGPKVSPPSRKGNLAKEQLAGLAQSLADEDFNGLPRQIGGPPKVNPHLYTVAFGERTVLLILTTATPLPKPGDGKEKPDPASRLGNVIRTVEKLTRGR